MLEPGRLGGRIVLLAVLRAGDARQAAQGGRHGDGAGERGGQEGSPGDGECGETRTTCRQSGGRAALRVHGNLASSATRLSLAAPIGIRDCAHAQAGYTGVVTRCEPAAGLRGARRLDGLAAQQAGPCPRPELRDAERLRQVVRRSRVERRACEARPGAAGHHDDRQVGRLGVRGGAPGRRRSRSSSASGRPSPPRRDGSSRARATASVPFAATSTAKSSSSTSRIVSARSRSSSAIRSRRAMRPSLRPSGGHPLIEHSERAFDILSNAKPCATVLRIARFTERLPAPRPPRRPPAMRPLRPPARGSTRRSRSIVSSSWSGSWW